MLNHLWFSFFAIAFLSGMFHWLVLGNSEIWVALVQSTFSMATTAFDISLGLVGILCLWLGLFAIAREAGLIQHIARGLNPLFRHLFPEVPQNHPAQASMTMNMAANMLGLDNAATPLGLKAMQELQALNPVKNIATNAQILFLVINTSSITLLPVTIFMYRAQLGAADPTSVFLPILFATSFSTFVGIMAVAWVQKLPIFNRIVLAYFGGFAIFLSAIAVYISALSTEEQTRQSTLAGNLIIFCIITCFIFAGWRKKVPVYEVFVEGAKEGFEVAIRIIPYLVAMLVAIGVLRASGALDGALWVIERGVLALGLNADFVPALPTAFMKPFSGSGARAMLIETMNNYGVDSFPALLSATIQGSTETTFYVLAVYFGSVGITQTRHAIACGLLADVAGITAAIGVGYLFFA
ncbi:MAG: spore maturation protein [Alphaproteobacteria bacterium]|nr:spore maturation protein [Alphaproteobacteria bacterium]